PSALPADGADGGLVARIDVGALVAIHLHGDEIFVDDFCDGGVFVTFAVNDVAPVAPDGANVEQNGLVLAFGEAEGVFAPFIPVDGLVRRRTQVGTGGIFQSVFGHGGMWLPLRRFVDGMLLRWR